MVRSIRYGMMVAVMALSLVGGAQVARAGFGDWAKKTWDNVKKEGKKAWKKTKKAAKDAKDYLDGVGKGIDSAVSKAMDDMQLGVLKKLAEKAWKYVKSYSCDTLMDSAFKVSSWKKNKTSEGLWLAGTCAHEFNKGVICSVPNLIQNSGTLLGEVIKSTWNNKQYCIPAGLLLGGPSPMAIAPTLLCGAALYLAKEAIKVGKCLSGIGKAMSSSTKRALLEEIYKFGCNLVGELSVDLVVAVATFRGEPAGEHQQVHRQAGKAPQGHQAPPGRAGQGQHL